MVYELSVPRRYSIPADVRVNLGRHLLGDVDPIVHQPALMIYGERDPVAAAPRLDHVVPNVDVASLDCGLWIQEELPDQTNETILGWLGRDRVG